MTLGKRLLLYSVAEPAANPLSRAIAPWGCVVSHCNSLDEFRGRVEGGDFDIVLVEPAATLRRLCADGSPEESLHLPLAEVEKRHIQRVLASTGGNKTRAARVLGIDTKTLYNKLKSYQASESLARKRLQGSGALPA